MFIRFILGMLVVLFFKCMTSLLNPIYRRGERIKWGLVSYTAVMFALATVLTGMSLHILSISFIDNREFSHPEGRLHPGPYGYFEWIYYKPINIIPNAAFCLNNWLADGLLVSSLFDSDRLSRRLTPSPLAPPLLRVLLQESLGHRHTLPHVPRFCGYAFVFSVNPGGTQN